MPLKVRGLKNTLGEKEWRGVVGKMFMEKAEVESIDFQENIGDYIEKCRADGGVPGFRTDYADTEWGEKGFALGVCMGGKGAIEGQWFKDVPKEDVAIMKRETGEWRKFREKYGE